MEKKRKTHISDDAILEELKRLAGIIRKNSVSSEDFRKLRKDGKVSEGVSESIIYTRFRYWNKALKKAGLEVTHRQNIPNEEIFESINIVWNKLGKQPSYNEYNEDKSSFSASLLESRFGSYLKAIEAYINWKNQNSDNSPSVEQDSEISKHTNNIYSEPKSRSKRRRYGSRINFRGMQHAPLNELGVVLLFGIVAKEIGFEVESVNISFPDCEAKKYDSKSGTYEKTTIEFEFSSSNFKKHNHDPDQCDLIVCWEHDWNDCPIEVLELSKIVKNLKE